MRVIFLDERKDGNRYKCSMFFGKNMHCVIESKTLVNNQM